jgi:hypothetical protein
MISANPSAKLAWNLSGIAGLLLFLSIPAVFFLHLQIGWWVFLAQLVLSFIAATLAGLKVSRWWFVVSALPVLVYVLIAIGEYLYECGSTNCL